MDKDKIKKEVRRKYAIMLDQNHALSILQKQFDLRIDFESENKKLYENEVQEIEIGKGAGEKIV